MTTNGRRRWSAAALLGMGAVGFALGTWNGHGGEVAAQPPGGGTVVPAAGSTDYSQRVIAYIHGTIPITREEFGEFLIARNGQNKMELFVNRKIIDHACKQLNVTVTPEEVEAAINDDLVIMNLDRATFVKQFLMKQYNKTLFEWKEDVIKPRLLLTKLCLHEVTVTDEDVKRAFEARYGEKVKCRMILWPKGQEKFAYQVYDKLRTSEAEFDQAARHQASSVLSAHGGNIDPLGRGAGDDDKVEKIAFKLKAGEVSELFDIPEQGIAVLRCEGRLPGDATKTFEGEKAKLHKIVTDQKVAKKIPEIFNKMKENAKPVFVLKYGTSDADVRRAAEEELKLLNQPDAAPGRAPVPLPPMK